MGAIEKMKQRGQLPRAAAYARFSSDNQREESIDAQLRAIKDYADKNGIVVIAEYVDKARSATTNDRPQFLQMLADSHQERFNIVLVHKLDRFARNRHDSIGCRMELKQNGVSLISVLEYLDEDSPESIILESVLEAMAEYYSKNLAREVKKGMKENALQCISTGGRPPFGYRLNPETRKYEIDENEEPAVLLIFQGVAEGKGYDQIIRELNALGYKTRNGNHFGKNSLNEIIRNEKYKGVYVFNRAAAKDYRGKRNNHQPKHEDDVIRIEGGIPAIIDEETFDAVARIIASRKKLSPSQAAKETYLLSGKIFCGECGNTFIGNRKLAGRNKTLYVSYRCNTRDRQTSDACRNKEIRREHIESFVVRELAGIIFDEGRIPDLVKQYQKFNQQTAEAASTRLKRLDKKIREVNGKIDNIISAIATTGSASLVNALESLEQEKALYMEEMQNEQARCGSTNITEAQIRQAYDQARELYLKGSLDEMRQLINLYLHKVVIYKEHVEVYLNVLPFSMIYDIQNNPSHAESRDGIVANAGGGGGNRTPVRKKDQPSLSERSPRFEFRLSDARGRASSG